MGNVKYFIYRNQYDEKTGLMLSTTREKEIIFCKDCKWNKSTPHNPICSNDDIPKDVIFFCADGERREDV